MTNTRDTGEHFLGPIWADDEGSAQASARRVADLSTQIDFLDHEIARYRELLEKERIRHATDVANLQLMTDTRLDDLRREERIQTQTLHDSYRNLLNERQLENETALRQSAAAHAAELAAERTRYEEILEHERTRRQVTLEATRKQTIDELTETHHHKQVTLQSEQRQATETIERLERELAEYVERARLAEIQVHDDDIELTKLRRRVDGLEADNYARLQQTETRLAVSEKRLDSERRRSAATLAELLERSATVAAEADKARSDYASEQAKSEHAATNARQRAEADYAALAEAADDRASRALSREAELETVIGELRDHLSRKRP